jgi:hypothetical protein
MTTAALSFTAALPTTTALGSNGQFFTQNKLQTTGEIAINTKSFSPTTGATGLNILAGSLTSNGLTYSPATVGVSGNQIDVTYNLVGPTDASNVTTTSLNNTFQAAAQASALTGNYPQGTIHFVPQTTTSLGNNIETTYGLTASGIPGYGLTGSQAQAVSFSTDNNGVSLSLDRITAVGNGLRVTYDVTTTPSTTATNSSDAVTLPTSTVPSGVTTLGDVLAGNFSGVTASSPNVFNVSGSDFSGTTSSGSFNSLADILSANTAAATQVYGAQTPIYNDLANASASTIRGTSLNIVA